jgi:hypothetical protein
MHVRLHTHHTHRARGHVSGRYFNIIEDMKVRTPWPRGPVGWGVGG